MGLALGLSFLVVPGACAPPAREGAGGVHGTAIAAAPPATVVAPSERRGAPRVLAGDGTAGFQDGVGAGARFHKPIRLAALGPESVLVADIFNHALRVVHADGRVRTLAGAPDRRGHRDGPAEQAHFASPHGVAVAPDGRIAVAEAENHTIRLLTPRAGSVPGAAYDVTTWAGAPGEEGLVDGPVAEARFRSPHAVVWTEEGALLVADIGNARIRRLHAGRVETVAGAEPGTFVYPMDLALAPDGRRLVADAGANKLLAFGAGGAVEPLRLDAPLATPHGVAAAADGTLYVADMKSHRVLAVEAAGHVTVVAGTGQAGSAAGQLNRPAAVLVHAGRLWVADLDNHRIVVVPLA